MDEPFPVDVLQVPFLAGPNKADWRYVNLLAILLPLKLLAPAGGVQFSPAHEAPPPRIGATPRDPLAGEPGRKHAHSDPGRVEIVAGLLGDRWCTKLYRLAKLPPAGLCQHCLQQCR